jgi:REP element-mobilizing transposase RayT
MPQSLARLHVHLVFSTKHRAPILHDGIRETLHSYMGGVLQTLGCGPVLTNSVEDHVHLLFELSRTSALSEVVGDMKRLSSRWLKAQEPLFSRFSWQRGYAAFAVSKSDLTSVHNYIAKQREHHREQDFQPEFRALLEDHGIAFDERYVWD